MYQFYCPDLFLQFEQGKNLVNLGKVYFVQVLETRQFNVTSEEEKKNDKSSF